MTVTKCCTCASGQGYDKYCMQSPHVGMAVVPALTNQETTGFKVKRPRGNCSTCNNIFNNSKKEVGGGEEKEPKLIMAFLH